MKKFQRKIEDFVCENCGCEVKGDGYTNHCPKCLWSKHVDVNPGDREEKCQGMMTPISSFLKSGENIIAHRCVKCGFERSNRINEKDDFDIVVEASSGFLEI
ncbi:MAG: RNHCP domain-containing protein [Patescibacteria group bacterium]